MLIAVYVWPMAIVGAFRSEATGHVLRTVGARVLLFLLTCQQHGVHDGGGDASLNDGDESAYELRHTSTKHNSQLTN